VNCIIDDRAAVHDSAARGLSAWHHICSFKTHLLCNNSTSCSCLVSINTRHVQSGPKKVLEEGTRVWCRDLDRGTPGPSTQECPASSRRHTKPSRPSGPLVTGIRHPANSAPGTDHHEPPWGGGADVTRRATNAPRMSPNNYDSLILCCCCSLLCVSYLCGLRYTQKQLIHIILNYKKTNE